MNSNNQIASNINRKNSYLVTIIIALLIVILGSTYAYFAFNASNNNTITGTAGSVDLELTVTKILPSTNGVDNILVINFNEVAEGLNEDCIDNSGEFALCQLYKVTLENNSTGVNTKVKGSISFDNETAPNLSWILVENYSASTTYTSTLLGSTYNTATSTFTNFVDNYLLTVNNSADFYILVWVNETEEVQTDEGSYSGTIRFEDSNGKGVTSTFSS